MKKVLGLILAIVLSGCSFLQVSPDVQDVTIDLIAFNAGCVGIIEAPEIIEPAAVIAQSGLILIDSGMLNIGDIITDLQAVLNIDFDNKVLQANITRMMGNIKIMMSPDADIADVEKVRVILESFIEGTKACGGVE